MADQLSPQSDWGDRQAQSGRVDRPGPRGAGWVIAALYIFSAVVVVSWFTGWGDDRPQTAAPPVQHQHSTHGTQG
jgi:hypothetical protein